MIYVNKQEKIREEYQKYLLSLLLYPRQYTISFERSR
jgi:hypothetical protein